MALNAVLVLRTVTICGVKTPVVGRQPGSPKMKDGTVAGSKLLFHPLGGCVHDPNCIDQAGLLWSREIGRKSCEDNRFGTIRGKSQVTNNAGALVGGASTDRFLSGIQVIEGDGFRFGSGRQQVTCRRESHPPLVGVGVIGDR